MTIPAAASGRARQSRGEGSFTEKGNEGASAVRPWDGDGRNGGLVITGNGELASETERWHLGDAASLLKARGPRIGRSRVG